METRIKKKYFTLFVSEEIYVKILNCREIRLDSENYGAINLDARNYGEKYLDIENYGDIDLGGYGQSPYGAIVQSLEILIKEILKNKS